MKLLRNTFIAGLMTAVCVVLTLGVQGASWTTTIQSGGLSNLLPANASARVTQVIITSMSTNAARVQLWDTPTNTVWYTNPAYVDVQSYLTNYITLYTNYFGATNAFTNYAMVDIARTNSATTNNYPLRFTAQAGTNASAVYDGVNYYFVNGVWGTNAGGGAATVTVTYQ